MACLTPCKQYKHSKVGGLPVFHLQTKATCTSWNTQLEEETSGWKRKAKWDKEGKGIPLNSSQEKESKWHQERPLFSHLFIHSPNIYPHSTMFQALCWALDKILKILAFKGLTLQWRNIFHTCTYKFIHTQIIILRSSMISFKTWLTRRGETWKDLEEEQYRQRKGVKPMRLTCRVISVSGQSVVDLFIL